MFVDAVSECDSDFYKRMDIQSSCWNHHEVERLFGEVSCRKIIGASQHAGRDLNNYVTKPMMTSCSGTYTQNADGSWSFKGEVVFAPRNDGKRGPESNNGNDNSV